VFSWKETLDVARALGITLQSHEVQGPKDFAAAFATIAEERPDALLVLQDAVTMQQRNEIVNFAIQKRLPSMFQEKGWAVAGGLMSYGENLPSMYGRAAYFVDRIFKGTKPADSRGTSHAVRHGAQSQNRQGAQPEYSTRGARNRRRGDRVKLVCCACSGLEVAPLRPADHLVECLLIEAKLTSAPKF
jgi:ABC transporter substrate binding protein